MADDSDSLEAGAKEVKSEVRGLVRALPKELAPSDSFASQVDKLHEQFEQLEENAIATWVAVRSSYTRGLRAVDRSVEVTEKVSGTCETIAEKIAPLAKDVNVISKVVAGLEIWGEAGTLGEQFIQLQEEMHKVSSCFQAMLDVVIAFVAKLKAFKEGVEQLLESVTDSLESCGTSFMVRLHRLCVCDKPRDAEERDFRLWPIELITQFEATLATFRSFLLGMFQTLHELWERLTHRGQEVIDMHAEVKRKLDDLEEPPSGFLEIVASPFKKTYQTIDLAVTFGGDFQKFVRMWDDCNTLSTGAAKSLGEAHDRVDDFWVDFVRLGHGLIDYFGVEPPAELEDREVLDVGYDPVSRTFLDGVEQGLANFLSCRH